MKTILFVLGGKVVNNAPTSHFLLRTQAAVQYCIDHPSEAVTIVVSGRWTSVTERYVDTEAEVAKQYILTQLPEVTVVKEDISVELIGNYAFSKPLIAALSPDTVIIFTSEVNKPRNEVIAKRIFADDLPYKFNVITDEHSDNEVLVAKERDATTLFEAAFEHVEDGDDAAFRTTLLYKTPYYFKGLTDDKDFFDTYWQGGFENYISARESRKKL